MPQRIAIPAPTGRPSPQVPLASLVWFCSTQSLRRDGGSFFKNLVGLAAGLFAKLLKRFHRLRDQRLHTWTGRTELGQESMECFLKVGMTGSVLIHRPCHLCK